MHVRPGQFRAVHLSRKPARPHVHKEHAPGGGFPVTAPIIGIFTGREQTEGGNA